MKTLKIALIGAIVACNMLSMANGVSVKENPESKKIKNVTLQQAEKIPGMIAAMYGQINQEDLMHSPSHIFVATVLFKGTTFRISGTLDQWVRFFRKEGLPQVNKQRPSNTL